MTAAPVQHDDTTKLAVIETKVDALGAAVFDIKASLATSSSMHVTRAEWELRNKLVDERHEQIQRRQAPWWSATAVVLSAIAVAWAILAPQFTR